MRHPCSGSTSPFSHLGPVTPQHPPAPPTPTIPSPSDPPSHAGTARGHPIRRLLPPLLVGPPQAIVQQQAPVQRPDRAHTGPGRCRTNNAAAAAAAGCCCGCNTKQCCSRLMKARQRTSWFHGGAPLAVPHPPADTVPGLLSATGTTGNPSPLPNLYLPTRYQPNPPAAVLLYVADCTAGADRAQHVQ